MGRFQRWPRKGFSSFAASIQPVPAYVGLVSCLVIVFVLNSVSMWNGDQLEFKALTVYLGVSSLPPFCLPSTHFFPLSIPFLP
jgi:hypothetical protein